jgi:zinc/manganese transport system substrate-binding protein
MRLQSKFSFLAVIALLGVALLAPSSAEAKKLKVVTTLTDLASLAQEVGGDKVDVEALAKGYQDPHFVEPKPSFLLKLRNADLLISVGLDLEIGWLPPLITQSGNGRIQRGAPGYLDASQFAEILEIPTIGLTPTTGAASPKALPPS